MAYEVFERTGERSGLPAVTIASWGRIGLNAVAARALSEAAVKSVILLWDQANLKIAFKAAAKTDKNAYAVSIVKRTYGTIRAKTFLKHIGWTASQAQTLPATWNPRDKMLEVSLPAEYVSAAPALAKRKSQKETYG